MARSESWQILLVTAIKILDWTVIPLDMKATYQHLELDPKYEIYVKDLKESRETEY